MKTTKNKFVWEEEDDLEDVYSRFERDRLLDDDELNAWEAAFMKGWDDAE